MKLTAKPIKEELIKEIASKRHLLKHPFFLVSDKENLDSFYYLKGIKKVLDDNSIPYTDFYINKDNLEESVKKVKKQASTSFTIIARPLGIDKKQEEAFISYINPTLDPDMISEVNLGKLLKGDLNRLPATISSVKKFIDFYHIDCDSKRALVIGRSLTVGLPLYFLLTKLNATVTIAHTHTRKEDLYAMLKNIDILALASGNSSIIREEDIHDGEIILDCGYHDGHGDLSFVPNDNVNYTPVPGGIGTLTSLCLVLNAIYLEESN